MFAITQIGSKQYKISSGDKIVVDKLSGEVGDTVTFDQVLLLNDKEIQVGTPYVKDAKVTAKILNQKKGDKIEVRRYKSKVRYRRQNGFRSQLTELQIVSIG